MLWVGGYCIKEKQRSTKNHRVLGPQYAQYLAPILIADLVYHLTLNHPFPGVSAHSYLGPASSRSST